MKKLIISILPIFMSLCVNAQIKLKGVRLYSNTYYYELKDVFVDTKGEQFTLESMRIMFYSPNGSDITVAIQIPGEAPIFMKVDDTKEEPLYDGYNKVGKLLKTLCSGQKCDWNIDFGYTASTTSAVDPTVIKIMNKIGSFMGVIDESYCGDNDQWFFPAYALRDTKISRGDRICQFRIFEIQPPIEFEECQTLSAVDRGGFGSTGRK